MNVKTNINHVSNHVIFRVLVTTLAFMLGVIFIWVTRSAWILLLVSFFLALGLSPAVNLIAKRITRGSRGLAIAVAYLIVVGLLGFLLFSVTPPLVDQTRSFVNDFPTYVRQLETSDSSVAKFARRYNIPSGLRNAESEISNNLTKAGGPILNIIQRIISSMAAMVTVLVLTLFMLKEGPDWFRRFLELQPKDKREHRRKIAEQMYRAVTGYVNGQILIATLGAVSAFIAMTIAGLPFALPIASVAFVLNLIPLIGATLAGVLIFIAAAFFKSLTAAIVLGIYLMIYQQVENSFIQPLIQAKAVNISPLMVLAAAIIGATLAGLLGALLAIPVAACVRILADDYIARHHLRHREPA